MARVRLSRELILDTAAELVRQSSEDVTLAQLGEALGVDATAFYRHFRDKDDLMRAVGDHILSAVTVDLPPPSTDWRATVTEICARLRAAHVGNPRLAELVRNGPPLNRNEFDLTERMLAELRAAGCSPTVAAAAYHALIEFTVGSAALDAALAAQPATARQRTYEGWRSAYRLLDPDEHPVSVKLAGRLYQGTADTRFRFGLDCLLDGIDARRGRRDR